MYSIKGIGLTPVEFTPTGAPKVSAAVLRKMAGTNPFGEGKNRENHLDALFTVIIVIIIIIINVIGTRSVMVITIILLVIDANFILVITDINLLNHITSSQ